VAADIEKTSKRIDLAKKAANAPQQPKPNAEEVKKQTDTRS